MQDNRYAVEVIYNIQPGEDWLDKARAARVTATPRPRVFKVGATLIHEDESTIGLPIDTVKPILAAAYPEVKHATTREAIKDGVTTIEFLPQPGRKG